MKPRKEYFILAAVIIVLIMYLVLHKSDRTLYQLPVLDEIAGKRITKLEIGKTGESIVLNKEDNIWYIAPNEYAADAGKVQNMLDVIANLTLTVLVSESRNYSRYDLSDDKKIRVKAWSDNRLAREFGVGKAAGTYRHTHIMLAGDPNVYHARGDFRNKFEQSVGALRDMTVLSFDRSRMQEIEIIKGEKAVVISPKMVPMPEGEKGQEGAAEATRTPDSKKVWQTAGGNEVDAPKLNQLLATLSELKCEKYINDAPKDNFKDPIYTVKLRNPKEYVLSIFEKTDEAAKNYPGISSANESPFWLSDSQVDNMKAIIEELLKTSAKS